MTSPAGIVARVRLSDLDRDILHLEFANGNIVQSSPLSLEDDDDRDYEHGELILLDADNQVLERNVPRNLWPRQDSIGVVRSIGKEKTLIQFGSSLRQVPNSDVDYSENCTVEADEVWGVSEVVSRSPITFFDRDEENEPAESYIVEPGQEEGLETYGGSAHLVERARTLIETPLLRADALKEIGAKPVKGVLFTGLPGTGKTKLARIIAANTGATFYAVSGPQVFNKWYGASEKIIRNLFKHAESQTKAVIFFDEIDSVAGQRGDDSHEVSKRVVAQLLTSMDGLKSSSNVVVIATTNRPDDIDKALRRPGRFDAELKFTLPNLEDRLNILHKSGEDIKQGVNLPLEHIAEATAGWTPADLSSVWTEAALCAVIDDRTQVLGEDLMRGHQKVVDSHKTRDGEGNS